MLCCTSIQMCTQKWNCMRVTGSNWTNAVGNRAHCVGVRYLKLHLHIQPNTFGTYHSCRFNPFTNRRTRSIPSLLSDKNMVLMAIFLICLGIHNTSEGLNRIVHTSQCLAIVDSPKGSEIPERNAHRNPLHLLPVA